MPHNLSIDRFFNDVAKDWKPRYRFDDRWAAQHAKWKSELLPALRAALGSKPQCVPHEAQTIIEWKEDGLIKQKVVFAVEPGLSASAYIFRPANATGRLPAILACHGHGQFGKEAVMGNRSMPEIAASINTLNYDYGLQMAKAGFVTMAIDWRGFGERDDRRKPHMHDIYGSRDPCNVNYLRATILGTTLMHQNIHDGSRALDYLCEQSFVDPQRLGVMGLSFGGTMTTWMSLMDDRIRAADIICYSDRFADFGMRDTNFCGSQIVPGVAAHRIVTTISAVFFGFSSEF